MAYRFRKKESVTAAVRRIMREEIDHAVDELKGAVAGRPKGLHEARKRIKKLRSLIRLVSARLDRTGKQAIALLTAATRPLSGLRDAQAMVEAFDTLTASKMNAAKTQAYAPLRQRLIERRDAPHESEAQGVALIATPIDQLREVRAMSQQWTIRPNGFGALSRGLRKSYAQAIDAMQLAMSSPSDEHFHEWRKHVKHHWYHLRLLRGLWPKLMIATAIELGGLSDLLGDDHDLAVMRQWMQKESPVEGLDRDELMQMINDRKQQLHPMARTLGQRLFAEKPKAIMRRLRAYWQAWHGEQWKPETVMMNVLAAETKTDADST